MVWHNCKTDLPKEDGKYILIYKLKAVNKIEWCPARYNAKFKQWKYMYCPSISYDLRKYDLIKWAEIDLSEIE